jgi:2-haloalkanoic acid dehalogenase type II
MKLDTYKAILLDFYGTLVEEDDPITHEIVEAIASRSPVSSDPKRIARDWRLQEWCAYAHGDRYRSQRELESESLQQLIDDYRVNLDHRAFTKRLFEYWISPDKFPDADAFVQTLKKLSYLVCIVSNIDGEDLRAALSHCGWEFETLVTSEDCRSYKPRPEMFRRALHSLNVSPDEAVHIGDSVKSDVAGAQSLGIDTVWVNRKARPLPPEVKPPRYTIATLLELTCMMEGE